jgi:DNA invertase Pin-like site-specific DNA recombinase
MSTRTKRGTIKAPKRESWGQRTRRRERAEAQNTLRATRSDKEQLALIATRPGESGREVSRLLLNAAVKKQHPVPTDEDIQGGVDFILDTRLGGE